MRTQIQMLVIYLAMRIACNHISQLLNSSKEHIIIPYNQQILLIEWQRACVQQNVTFVHIAGALCHSECRNCGMGKFDYIFLYVNFPKHIASKTMFN